MRRSFAALAVTGLLVVGTVAVSSSHDPVAYPSCFPVPELGGGSVRDHIH